MHVLICTDKPGHGEVRAANRDAHLAHLHGSGLVVRAGPFIDAAGAMAGSLVVLDTADRAEAEAFAAADPYARAGLFAEVRIERWHQAFPAP